MKKLTALFLAAGMVMAASAPASAVDVKFDGNYQFTFEGYSSGFDGKNEEFVAQRLRLGATFAASENLSGYLQFQFGTDEWGTRDYKHGTHGKSVAARQVYIDWKVPGTPVQVRMGRQAAALPAEAFGGNSVMDAGGSGFMQDGIVVASPVTDWLGLSAMWMRFGADGTDVDASKNNDLFAAIADLKFDGISGAVYAAYASFQDPADVVYGARNFSGEGDAYWVGATATLSAFDPFTLKLSALYGEASADEAGVKGNKGWDIQAKASYAMDFGTPVFGGWYASGAEDGNGNMPTVGGYFAPTTTYYDGAYSLGGGNIATDDIQGTWGVMAGIEGFSFLQNLTHDFTVAYIAGTNEYVETAGKAITAAKYLTDEDATVEFNFNSHYKIYKNLVAHLELAYLINDLNDKAVNAKDVKLDEDDWRVALTFQYKF